MGKIISIGRENYCLLPHPSPKNGKEKNEFFGKKITKENQPEEYSRSIGNYIQMEGNKMRTLLIAIGVLVGLFVQTLARTSQRGSWHITHSTGMQMMSPVTVTMER